MILGEIKDLVGDHFDSVREYFQGRLDEIIGAFEGKVDAKLEEVQASIDVWASELMEELHDQVADAVREIKKVIRIGLGLMLFGAALIGIACIVIGNAI